MPFEIDKQTINDLELFGTYKKDKSVFAIFDRTQSNGGKSLLNKMFDFPLTDIKSINDRQEAIIFFQQNQISFEIDKNELDFVEHYLNTNTLSLYNVANAYYVKLKAKFQSDNNLYIVERGISYTIDVLNSLSDFIENLSKSVMPAHLKEKNERAKEILQQDDFERIKDIETLRDLRTNELPFFDNLFKRNQRKELRFLLDLYYEYDVYYSIAQRCNELRYIMPQILPQEDNIIEIEGLCHPFLENPIKASTLSFSTQKNLSFITGPNMAGKSTFLKSLGVAVFLSHIGFPVPANKMRISLRSGIATTINITDDLSFGYSHFYSEVMRIKKVAQKIQANENMLIIFDELFRGTNLKDAYDGTLAVISAFSEIRNCSFAISTHIVEVAEQLKGKDNLQFHYLDVDIIDGIPTYTYELKEGISECRLGMYIINKENIIQTINSIKINKR